MRGEAQPGTRGRSPGVPGEPASPPPPLPAPLPSHSCTEQSSSRPAAPFLFAVSEGPRRGGGARRGLMEPGVPLRLRVVGAPRRDAWARLPVALAQATHDALALDVSGGGGLPLPLELVADLGLPGTPAPRWLVAWDGGSSAGADLELPASLMACLGEFSLPIHEDPPPLPDPPPHPPTGGWA